MSTYAALATRIRGELADLVRCVDRAGVLLNKARDSGDSDYLDGVALNLHAFYTGVEHALEAIAREIDGGLPGGAEWHRDLLMQMSGAIPKVRPAVLSTETRHCLDAYRGFRHVVRNIYGYNLDEGRIRELTEGLASCFGLVTADLAAFAMFLESLE